jgi:hypothetical protein
MAWLRHAALIRTFTLFLLLLVGFDLGAHGLFASDFTPMATSSSSISLGVEDSGASTHPAPDHCFCHGTSMGAVVPASSAGLTPVGTVAVDLSPQAPHGAPHPLDRPPQLTA